MTMKMSLVALALFTTLAACGDDDDSTATDGGGAVDGAVATPDSATAAGNSWSLDGVIGTGAAQCGSDIMVGFNSSNGFQFVFMGTPVPGTYTVVPQANIAQRPSNTTSTTISYGTSAPGAAMVEHVGQSGTVTVSLVGGKLHAVAVGIPSKDLRGTMATGTIAASLTCP